MEELPLEPRSSGIWLLTLDSAATDKLRIFAPVSKCNRFGSVLLLFPLWLICPSVGSWVPQCSSGRTQHYYAPHQCPPYSASVTDMARREQAWKQVHMTTQMSLSRSLHGRSFCLQLWVKHLNPCGDQVLWKLRLDLVCLGCVFSGSFDDLSSTLAWPNVFFFAHTWLSSLPLCPSLS